MSDQSPNLSLPFIMPAQAQKHVTHNEAIELLDLIVQLTLVSISEAAPPPAPAEGEAWAVPATAGGAWAGQAGQIATWRGGGWLFVAPVPGWRAWVVDVAALHVWAADGWVPQARLPDLQHLPGLGINARADTVNRLTLRAVATLLDHDGGGHQVKINKAAPHHTGSLLFQTDYGGRAEMGLAGDDDFSVKTSADGADWVPAIKISASSGRVQLMQALQLAPGPEPAAAQAGELYFDSATAKLRCFDGADWRDLF
ncbi:MAG: DUF2793 domain-containing protein [Loktanella sp.]|nr:DUF2793 domain-containing protein [Loktanella sp.]